MAGAPASSPREDCQTSVLVPLRHATDRRHRGRPAGSKNKPKQPIIIARESPSSLRAHAMEVAPGCDVSACVAGFSRRLRCGVCVLSGRGYVANVTLRQGSSTSTVTLHGRFEILSLLGTFLPPPAGVAGMSVFLSGAQGQVVGGTVVRPLVASGRVIVMAASFANASFERLPAAGEEDGGGRCNGHQIQANVLARRPLQLEDVGGLYGVLSSVPDGPPELCAWPPAVLPVGKK